MGRFINLGIAIVNTSYIIRVEMESDGRGKSICPMVRCFAAITSMPPNYMAQMKERGCDSLHLQEELRYDQSHSMSHLMEATFMKVQYTLLPAVPVH